MQILTIANDEKILRAVNEEATLEEAKEIIQKLELSLKHSKASGLGLAAPQIGINKKVCIIRVKHRNNVEEFIDLVNPVIIEEEHPFINNNEGCLSLPNLHFSTQRFDEIFVKDDLHPAGVVAQGITAVVMQHEIDHTNSILVVDRKVSNKKIGPNEPCPCGKVVNGKIIKYKKCHGRIK